MFPVHTSPYGLCGSKAYNTELELVQSDPRICVKTEVAALGSPFLKFLMVLMDATAAVLLSVLGCR